MKSQLEEGDLRKGEELATIQARLEIAEQDIQKKV